MRRLLPRGIRGRLLLSVILVVAAAIVALTVVFNVVLARSLDANADNLLRARSSAVLDTVRVVDGHVVASEAPDDAAVDPLVWIFDGSVPVESPRAPAAVNQVALDLAGAGSQFGDVSDPATRLYTTPISREGAQIGSVVVGLVLEPYEHAERVALIGSLAFAAILLLVVALTARWMLSAALRPVARMSADADAWSETDLDRRFGVTDAHDELTALAQTLDRLLDRIAASFRHEQRFSAELSHELRTPLARVETEAELALRHEREPAAYREALTQILRNAKELSRTLDALVAASRHEDGLARGTADAAAAVDQAIEACSTLAESRGVTLSVTPPRTRARIGVDADLAARILQPIVENACRYARTTVRVDIDARGPVVTFRVEDDGPGIAPAEAERIFEPGVRGSAAQKPEAHEGAGLGLALSRRLARSASGDVEVGTADGGGASFVLRLPAT